MRYCKCGCGRSWDHDALPSRMRGRRFHPECPNSPVFKNNKRSLVNKPPQLCGCGVCGLTFQPYRRRRYAPDCPVYEDIQRAQAQRAYAAQQRMAAGLPARGEQQQKRAAKRLNNRHGKRCNTCEAMPWRRPPGGCPECGGAHQEENTEGMRAGVHLALRSNGAA
jgi:hypothetical protein